MRRNLTVATAALVTLGTGGLAVDRLIGAARMARVRRAFERHAAPPPAPERFDPALVRDVPEPGRRYFLHAIATDTPLARAAVLQMQGEIQTAPGGAWWRLDAREWLVPDEGFLWAARAGAGLVRFSGADWYLDGAARTEFRLWGLLPVARASGPDVVRSARGRLAGEMIWCPAALLPDRGALWERLDDRTARVTRTVGGELIPLTLTVDAEGRLRSAVLPRWGNQTPDGRFATVPFGVDVLEERTFGGYTVPARVSGGWWHGTDRAFDFFRPVISDVQYR